MDDKIYLEPDEAPSIQIIGQGKEVFRIKADGTPMLGPDATVDDAAKALVDAIGNGTHKYISEIKAENEGLREKYEKLLGASVCFQIAIQNALFVFERTVDDIHQTQSSHAQMSDDKGQL